MEINGPNQVCCGTSEQTVLWIGGEQLQVPGEGMEGLPGNWALKESGAEPFVCSQLF